MDEASSQRWVYDLITECNEVADAEPLAVHQFNLAIAVDYGIPAALVFQSVHDRCQKSGLKAVLVPLSVLVSQHSYLGRSALYGGLNEAVSRHNRMPRAAAARGRAVAGISIRLASPDLYDRQRQPHSFDVSLATQIGVVPALVYKTAQHVNLNSQLLDCQRGTVVTGGTGWLAIAESTTTTCRRERFNAL